jgi:hypothetical protein
MQMKRWLSDRRSSYELKAAADECFKAGYQCIADVLWEEALAQEKREDRRRRIAQGSDEAEEG